MQVSCNRLPLVWINAPEIFSDRRFQEWLNAVSKFGRKGYPGDRIATWHWAGYEPSEMSDIFMTVDGPDGSDSDMPKHCWDMILSAVALALPDSYPECIVWLTNLDEFFEEEGWLTVPKVAPAAAEGSRRSHLIE